MTGRWPLVRLGEVLRLEVDAVPVDPSTSYPLAGVYGFGRGLIRRQALEGSNTTYKVLHRLHEGDFVMSQLKAWEGALSRIPASFDGWFLSPQFPTFRPVESRLDVRYLDWFFKQPDTWENLKRQSRGMGARRDSVSPRAFLDLAIPLPPLPDQRRIVARLAALEERRQAVVFLARSANDESGALWRSCASRLLQSLEDCPSRRLGDLVEIRGGGTPSKADSAAWDGAVPWVTPKDMKANVIRDSLDHISERATETSPAKMIEAGAVLIVVRGMILVRAVPVGVLGVRAAVNQDMKALLPRDDVSAEFLAWNLRARQGELLDLIERSTHDTRKLQSDRLLKFSMRVPSRERQEELVMRLEALETLFSEMQRQRDESLAALDSFSKTMLRSAFGGPQGNQLLSPDTTLAADLRV